MTPIRPAMREDTSWHRFVRMPDSKTILPKRIIDEETRGDVRGARGMVGGEDVLVLTRCEGGECPCVVVDFGMVVVGTVEIDFEGAERMPRDGDDAQHLGKEKGLPGLRLAFSETMRFLGERSDFTRSDNGDRITPGTDQIAVPLYASTWTNTHGCAHPGGRVASDGLHGFRYLRISLDALASDAPYTVSCGRVKISQVRLQLSAYHGTKDKFRGWFECSDEELSQWWFDAVYTSDLCTDVFRLEDTEPRDGWSEGLEGKLVVHDAPKRDRDPYVGDLGVVARTIFCSRGEEVWDAVKNVLVDLAAHQRSDGWIPPASIFHYRLQLIDYPLWWVVCSYDLVLHTGDVEYIRATYGTLCSVLDNFYPAMTNPVTHLIERGRNQTRHYGDYAFVNRTGPVTYYNAMYVRALRAGATMAKEVGNNSDAEKWEARAGAVAESLAKRNWDSNVGAFFDGTEEHENNRYVDTHPQDGNSMAILAGVVELRKARQALAYYDSAARREYGNAFYDNNAVGWDYGARVYAFISFFEIAARFETWLDNSALEELRRLYRYMSKRDPGVTFWEGVGKGYVGPYTSMAHGWATGVAPLLTEYVLGIRCTGIGWKSWALVPHYADLDWAKGQVGTPFGSIRATWSWQMGLSGKSVSVEVQAPDGTDGEVWLNIRDGLDRDLSKLVVRQDGVAVICGAGDEGDKVVRESRGARLEMRASEDGGGGWVVVPVSGGKECIISMTDVE